MNCPRCKEELVKELREGEDILVCKYCTGMWLHRHQLDNLLKESGGNVELCSIDDNKHEDRHNRIKCRECRDVTMEKINFLDYSKIILDYCPSCGSFWVDKNELENMHHYISEIEKGSRKLTNVSAYNLLEKLSRIAYSIFH